MKAAEYAERFREARRNPPLRASIYDDVPIGEDGPADFSDVVIMICRDLMREAQAIIKARRAQLPDACGAVVREQYEKSRAIARRLAGEVPDEFFMAFLKAQHADAFTGEAGRG